jgi:hypothetical protein
VFPAEDDVAVLTPSREEEKLLRWRTEKLEEGGFFPEAAEKLAGEGVDYRRAISLLMLSGDVEWTLDQLL